MRIQTNIGALYAHRNLTMTQAVVTDSMGKLSSGFRINRAADDAAGLAISNKLRAETRSLVQASRNIEQANAALQVAEGAAGSIQKILERMKELATQAASENNAGQLTALNNEFTTLRTEIERIADGTKYQGDALIDGTFSGSFQVGATANATDQIAVALSTGLEVADLSLSSTDVSSAANASSALTALDTAIGTVGTVLGTIGAYQNRLDYAAANNATAIVNLSAAESVIRDVDMAEEMTRFSKNQILAQAGTAMLAQANQSAQSVLQLLRG
jgi:flagellin